MKPSHIVVVFQDDKILCATIAYSMKEANEIASNWNDFQVEIVEVDYSMGGE